MIARIAEERFILVVNAACKNSDLEYLKNKIGDLVKIKMIPHRSLLALQGPKSAEVMKRLGYDFSDMGFMSVKEVQIDNCPCLFTRSGYTGEDGFEISMGDEHASQIANLLLHDNDVEWIGLGARDSLRMEAGLSLYGHEITESTTPIEASLLWGNIQTQTSRRRTPWRIPGRPYYIAANPKKYFEKVGWPPARR